jgi:putative colanic acid biosynthesis UDP-glucose lipid carrier transferase
LISFALVKFNFDDVRELHAPNLVRRNFLKLFTAITILTVCLLVLGIFNSTHRSFIITFFCIAWVVMCIYQWITRKALTFLIRRTNSRAIILGAGQIGQSIDDEFQFNLYLGVKILGLFDDNPNQNEGKILGTIEEAKEYILRNKVTKVYCALPLHAEEKISDFIKFAEKNVIKFHIIPPVYYYYSENYAIVEQIGEIPVFSQHRIPLSYAHNAVLKRGFDIIFSLIFLITLFPLVYLLMGILIKISSPGPVFFKQKRTGVGGRSFQCYKFRSMRCSSDAHTKQATADDNRKTRIGNFMRKTSIDELPQFINVFRGDMSIVGPRPHMLLHTSEYSPKVDEYMSRHFIRPGITGWAQINGYRGETKEIDLMEKRIKADLWYIENWSFWLDIEIILKTALMVFNDKNAY